MKQLRKTTKKLNRVRRKSIVQTIVMSFAFMGALFAPSTLAAALRLKSKIQSVDTINCGDNGNVGVGKAATAIYRLDVNGLASVTTPALTSNDTSVATTAFVKAINKVTTLGLAADISNTTTTAAKVTGLDLVVPVGTYAFQYFIVYRSAATGTGLKCSVNHTGTLTSFVANMRYADNSTTNVSAAIARQAQSVNTPQVVGTFTARVKSATASMGPTLGVDTANADLLVILEGHMVVTVAGTMQLYFTSEVAGSAITIKAGTGLILTEII